MSKATIVLVFAITITVTFSCAPKEHLMDLRAKSSIGKQIDDLESQEALELITPVAQHHE